MDVTKELYNLYPSPNIGLKVNFVAIVRKRTIPTERPPLSVKLVPTFAGRWCCVISVTNSHGR
jgi:hypothetical protein